MRGLRRRTVIEWLRCQSKYKVMYSSASDRFHIHDTVNGISVGAELDWEAAAEFCFNLAHNTLTEGE